MPETADLFAEVAHIRDEVEETNEMVGALVRLSADKLKAEILDKMRKDSVMGEIFLLVNGSRSQGEILKDLQGRGITGASAASVSRKLELLHKEHNLVIFVRRVASGKVYRITRLAEVLDLRRALQKGK